MVLISKVYSKKINECKIFAVKIPLTYIHKKRRKKGGEEYSKFSLASAVGHDEIIRILPDP